MANETQTSLEAATLPPGIEIFRAGRHIDDAGEKREFTIADLAAIAAAYQPDKREAPLVVGHPTTDAPAYGWVGAVRSEGDRLLIDARDVAPAFAEMVKARRFPKRSAAFYPPAHPSNPTPGSWYLRHVGFLGAQPPAIAGLKDIRFSDADAGVVSFSESPQPSQEQNKMDDELKQKLADAESALAKSEAEKASLKAEADAAKTVAAQFAEAQKAERHAAHVQFTEAQVAAGRLLPKDKASAVAVLDALADAAPVEFAEGDASKKVSPALFVKELLQSRPPVVQFGEFASATLPDKLIPASQSDADVDKAARAYAAQHNVGYAEAIGKVIAFTHSV
ncbi:MAG: hypothetical protein LBU53_07590 [Zoogloeaceae bacterium]|nr:hypothetical protein [Zoogloeaceae bacterium]